MSSGDELRELVRRAVERMRAQRGLEKTVCGKLP
jgi:hypothetical protein